MNPVASAVLSAAIGIVSAGLATHLALRRFRYEQLWQRKHQAYVDLLTALHNIELTMRKVAIDDGEGTNDAKLRYGNAVADILHAVNVGRLVLPTTAVDVLEGFRKTRWQITGSKLELQEMYSNLRQAALETRDKIVEIARRDLRTND